MKYLCTFALIALSFVSEAQIITTIAGNGATTCPAGGGPATASGVGTLGSIAVDTIGNVYIGSGSCSQVKKISVSGIIITVAGTGMPGYSGDNGLATDAAIGMPAGLAVDRGGNLYICDSYFCVIRKIDPTGIITTIGGTGCGYGGDGGAATAASLNNPHGIAVDTSGNIFIADANNYRIRKISTTGIITTVAGIGLPGYSGDGGPAFSALLQHPEGMAADNYGNIYFADTGRIRKIDAGGTITSIAGDGTAGYSGDGAAATAAQLNDPQAISTDNYGNVLIADANNNVIRRINASGIITTFAGNGTAGHSGDGGPATLARLNTPQGIAIGKHGSTYIAEMGAYVRRTDTCPDLGAGTIIGLNSSRSEGIDTFCYDAELIIVGGAAGGVWGLTNTTKAIVKPTADGSGFIMPNAYGAVLDTVFYAVTNLCGSDTAFLPIIIIWCSDAANYIPADEHETAIYPNPAYDELTIAAAGMVTGVAIINPVGQVVRSYKYGSRKVTMNIADIPPGMYILRINGTEVRKFLKQ